MTKASTPKPASATKLDLQKPDKKADATLSKQPKSQIVIGLLSGPDGASLDDLCKATGWQAHSARAFLTGLKKKGYGVDSDKVDGIRRYRAVPPEACEIA